MRRCCLMCSIALAFCLSSPVVVLAQEPGTLGFSVLQLYGDDQVNKRGVLIVRRVDGGSAAAEAGMVAGDIIVSVNGTATEGHDAGS